MFKMFGIIIISIIAICAFNATIGDNAPTHKDSHSSSTQMFDFGKAHEVKGQLHAMGIHAFDN